MSRSALITMISIAVATALATTTIPAHAGPNGRTFRAIGFAAIQIFDVRSQVADVQAQVDELREQMNEMRSHLGSVETQLSGLNGQLDDIYEDIDALVWMTNDMKTQMEATALGSTEMQEQITANERMIEELQAEVAALWLQLAAESGGVMPDPCPPGSAIREISEDGSVICEIDGIGDYTHQFESFMVSPGTIANMTSQCPDGRDVLTGGFSGADGLQVISSWPSINRSWLVSMKNPTAVSKTFFIVLRCAKSQGQVSP